MKIEKKILRKSEKLSSSAKAAIAASLGVAASFALSACISDSSEVNSEESKNSEQTCGITECGHEFNSPSEASPCTCETVPSSSNKVIGIPLSGEHYSSSSIEALSSAAHLSAMRPISSSITAGIPHVYSSPTVPPSSSSITTPPLAGDIIPIEHSSSSSATQPSSSSANDETIKKNPKIDSTLVPIIVPNVPVIKDSLIPNIHLCEDPNCHKLLIDSMVTTLETDDIA